MKRTILILLTIILISASTLSINYSPNDKVWMAYDVYNEPIGKVIEIHPDWVFRVLNIWGNTLEEAKRYSRDARPLVKRLSEKGIRSSSMIGGISVDAQDDKKFIEEAAARNPLGEITGVDDLVLHGCYNRETWRDRLNEFFDIAIKSGVDAIELDQPAQEHWRGECYCNECNSEFTEWLIDSKKKDVSKKFDYVEFLRGRRLAHINEGDREIVSPYGQLYWEYQIARDSRNVSALSEEFLSKNRDNLFFGNSWGLAGEYIPSVHSYTNIDIAGDMRTPWIWEPDSDRFGAPYNSWIPVVKLARAIDSGKPILSFLDTYPYEKVLEEHKDRKDQILSQFASEMIASGAEFVFPYSNRVAYKQIEGFGRKAIEDYIKFIKNNREFFRDRSSKAPILLIVDEKITELKRFYKQYWAIAYYILDSSLDYDVIFRKDLPTVDITAYKKIIDCSKYSESIFKYCYDKDEHYMKRLESELGELSLKVKIDGDDYTRVINTSNHGKDAYYIVPAQLRDDRKVRVIYEESQKHPDIVYFPETIKKNVLTDKKESVITFDSKPFLIIIRF